MLGLPETRQAVPVAEVQAGVYYQNLKVQRGKKGGLSHCSTVSLHQVSDRAENFGSGLLQRGLKPNPDTFIGIFAQNRPEVCCLISVFLNLQVEILN